MPAPAETTDAYRDSLAAVRASLLPLLVRWWDDLDGDALDASFTATAASAVALVSVAQTRAAATAPLYLARYLAASGVKSPDRQPLNPRAFAGRCLDGRPLTGPLYAGVVEVKRRIAVGQALPEARAAGLSRVTRAVVTEVADAGRESLAGAMTLERRVNGYRRAVRLPACGRCLVLAGKRAKLEDAFLRHPRCDCINEPDLGGKRPEGDELFGRMTPAEQDHALGKEAAERVRKGDADLSSVVNDPARRGGMTAQRPARRELRAGRKPTPLDLRTEADGDADRYAELMRAHGYLKRLG